MTDWTRIAKLFAVSILSSVSLYLMVSVLEGTLFNKVNVRIAIYRGSALFIGSTWLSDLFKKEVTK
jgi:hypothetical protein